MAITDQRVAFYSPTTPPTAVAPLVEGSAFTAYNLRAPDNGTGGTNSAFTGRRGLRINLPTAQDLTTHRYFSFFLYGESFGWVGRLSTIATGGVRVVLVDGSGNYAGYNVYGSDIPGRTDEGPRADGLLGTFFGASNLTVPHFFIDHERTPDISSGVLDKTNIVAIEASLNNVTSGGSSLWLGHLAKHSQPFISGTSGNTFTAFADSFNVISSGYAPNKLWQRLPWYQQSAAGQTFICPIGLKIGNGSTPTTLTQADFLIGLNNTYDKSPAFRSVGPVVQLDGSNTRQILVDQSASDVLTFTDSSIASAAWWQWVLQGSGTATCTRVQFWRYSGFQAAHGAYTDCAWNGGDAPVLVNTSTTITRGIVRDATAGGLTITSGPGVYGNIDCDFSGNASFDISMGSGGAGTYELTNIGVVGAYTLKIRNDSTTNAIVVAIPAGISFSTSTAGGTITISTPAVYQSVTVNGLVAGSRLQIYDTTADVELANVITGTSYTWTDPSPAAANRAIRVRIAYVSGTDARLFIDTPIGTAGTLSTNAALSYLANQSNDDVYIANAIDGSAVTGITISDSIDRMIINIAGGSVSWPQIYAYNVYWLHTEEGIRDDGAIITAVDTANYRVTGFKIRNSSTTPLSITGGYGVDTATGSVASLVDAAGSVGNIYQTPDIVIAYATGSGLAPDERAKLMAAALETTAQNAAQQAALAAALSA